MKQKGFRMGGVLMVFLLLMGCGLLAEETNLAADVSQVVVPQSQADKVVTIYFAGTGLSEKWYDPGQAKGKCGPGGVISTGGFFTSELVAYLHYYQKTTDTHKKLFINGIGTGCPGFCLLQLGQRGLNIGTLCRGWDTLSQEAEKFIVNVEGQIILNLVGFSRGSIAAMRFAKEVSEMATPADAPIKDRIKKINILVFDPVPGQIEKKPLHYCLNDKVNQYVGIYATNERSLFFAPQIPDFNSPETKSWMFRVPGSHETMVGNLRQDGHATLVPPQVDPLFSDPWRDEEDLKKVSQVTSFIALRLLGSPQWGKVEFGAPGSPGEPGGSVWPFHGGTDESQFVQRVSEMWNYDFSFIQSNSFVLKQKETYPSIDGKYRKTGKWTCSDGKENTGLEMNLPPLDDGKAALVKLRELANLPAVADANDPNVVDEGTPVTFDASGFSEPDGDSLK